MIKTVDLLNWEDPSTRRPSITALSSTYRLVRYRSKYAGRGSYIYGWCDEVTDRITDPERVHYLPKEKDAITGNTFLGPSLAIEDLSLDASIYLLVVGEMDGRISGYEIARRSDLKDSRGNEVAFRCKNGAAHPIYANHVLGAWLLPEIVISS